MKGSPVTWNFSGVTLEDGSSVTGSFVFDASTYVRGTPLTDYDISVSGGSVLPSQRYAPDVPLTSLTISSYQDAVGTNYQLINPAADRSPATPRLQLLYLVPETFLSDAGGTIPLQLTQSYADLNDGEVSVAREGAVSGSLIGDPTSATPEPATLLSVFVALAYGAYRHGQCRAQNLNRSAT